MKCLNVRLVKYLKVLHFPLKHSLTRPQFGSQLFDLYPASQPRSPF